MASSGSTDFTASRNQIIRHAALDIGAIEAGVTMGPDMMADFAFRLNAMVKRWQAKSIHVWTVAEATLFPQIGQANYAIGPGTADHVTQSYAATQISVAALSGDATVSVDSIAGISANDFLGVVLDDGTLQWTTVVGAPSGLSITLAAPLSDTVQIDNRVYAYTTKIVRPLKVVGARRYEVASARDIPIDLVARLDYMNLPTKTTPGAVTRVFYDPQLGQGLMKLYNAPQDVASLVNFTWYRPIQDFDTAGNTPDLPQEWISALISNLANEMKHQFSVPIAKGREIERAAVTQLDDLIGSDREGESIFFQPDMGSQ